jgi:hypothetical protein
MRSCFSKARLPPFVRQWGWASDIHSQEHTSIATRALRPSCRLMRRIITYCFLVSFQDTGIQRSGGDVSPGCGQVQVALAQTRADEEKIATGNAVVIFLLLSGSRRSMRWLFGERAPYVPCVIMAVTVIDNHATVFSALQTLLFVLQCSAPHAIYSCVCFAAPALVAETPNASGRANKTSCASTLQPQFRNHFTVSFCRRLHKATHDGNSDMVR